MRGVLAKQGITGNSERGESSRESNDLPKTAGRCIFRYGLSLITKELYSLYSQDSGNPIDIKGDYLCIFFLNPTSCAVGQTNMQPIRPLSDYFEFDAFADWLIEHGRIIHSIPFADNCFVGSEDSVVLMLVNNVCPGSILSDRMLSNVTSRANELGISVEEALAQRAADTAVGRVGQPEEMANFVGCFLTGTAAEITPVSQIDKYNFSVCNVIKDLSESYHNLVRKKTAT